MNKIQFKHIRFGGISIYIPEQWTTETRMCKDGDSREYSMVEVSTEDGNSSSFIMTYGLMPSGSDSLLEAGKMYESILGEIGPNPEDDPIREYDLLGRANAQAYGFEFHTEDNHVCNYICVPRGSDEQLLTGVGCKLFTVLVTSKTFEDIDNILDMIEDNIYLKP